MFLLGCMFVCIYILCTFLSHKHTPKEGHISIREDCDPHADVGIRSTLTSAFLAYTTPYLLLGLETMFGITLAPWADPEYDDVIRKRLLAMVETHVLTDPNIESALSAGSQMTLSRGQHLLTKMLTLILVLDKVTSFIVTPGVTFVSFFFVFVCHTKQ